MTQYLMRTYGRLPLAFSRGEGSWLWDLDGNRYLDCVTGVAVNGIGHAHPRLVAAIASQATRIIHASNLYRIPEQATFSARLRALSACGLIRSFLKTATAAA